jgi:hypothetical protein
MKTIRKLTPAVLKSIIAEEKQKIIKAQKVQEEKEKLNLSKEQLLELALIHKQQKAAIAEFKRLHEKKERIKKIIKKR